MTPAERSKAIQKLLLEGGYGPDVETGEALLHMAAGIFVMEGHGHCAQAILEKHVAGWTQAFEADKAKP